MKKANENLEWIKNNKASYIAKNGKTIQHRSDLTGLKWACLICRGLCDCESCSKELNLPRLSFNKRKTTPCPDLNGIQLLYSEEEIWTRLQIREFIFRFGSLYDFDSRLVNSLQNVQGDWKIKRLGAYIVWKFLIILNGSGHYELLGSVEEESVPQRARRILNDWMMEKKIYRLYLDVVSRQQALLDILFLEGMTGKRWQDIAELLALANLDDIPVPTSRDINQLNPHNKNNNNDDDSMDIDDDTEELQKRIRRFQKSSRSSSLLSTQDELKMIHMLLELLLFETLSRHSLNMPKTKENKDMELNFKKYTKDYHVEESKKKSQRNSLLTRISQLRMLKGKEEDLKMAQSELDLLETVLRDDRMEFEKKKLELAIHNAKIQKRMEAIGHDKFGNEYWVFSDILDHTASDYRNSEPYWAYGIILIGPGYDTEKETTRWWYISGKKNLTMLIDWIKQNQDKDQPTLAIESFINKINQRVEYLTSLEWVVYGDGFFS
ncbi:uncharacterized protein BX663DRAFT_100051 [Cokeromyces recurvatus]|uniref:uncharacterized protein n=1 Tax=Cokeromyces recurvatus TaxID=90255 RepID=UPI0022208AFC|nr:uncharacterized protein BX663DRAFT_100051 [Cokeromyces recurvatus]KAI7901649.1 hypothetical protein BX663DRAFT_100051 [Cokeromyces recurvatus]